MELTARLTAFLETLKDVPVTWGRDDCSAAPALWVKRARGIDVPLPKYSSREQAARLIAKAGGLVNLWDECLSGLLFQRAGPAETGDVGIIDTARFGPIGVICGSPGVCICRHPARGWSLIAPRSHLRLYALD